MYKKLLILLFLFFIFNFNFNICYAKDGNELDLSSIENISKELQEEDYLPDISFSKFVENYKETGSTGFTFKSFLNVLGKFLFQEVTINSKLMVELLSIGMLCAVLENIERAFSNDGVQKIAYYACFLVMVVIIVKSFITSVQLGQRTITSMIEFTNALIPVLLTLLASSGGITSAAVLDPVVMILIKIVTDIIRDVVLPMTILILILNIVDSLSDEIKVSRLAELIKQIDEWVLGFIMTIFIGFMTVRVNSSATFDQAALKGAKFAVDNLIPVVGKCLSDAISSVASYSQILKDAVSTAGLVVMILICIFPLIKIILISLIYKFVGAIMEPVVDKKVVSCLSAAGDSMIMVFACVLCVTIMFFIMITIISSTGKLLTLVR